MLRRLSRRRSVRSELGRHLIDGPVLVEEALDAGVGLQTLYVEPSALGSPLVERTDGSGIPVRAVPDGSLAKVLDLRSPRSMVAVATTATHPLAGLVEAVRAGDGPLLVAVCVSDPGNLGTLVRVAEASGCTGLAVTEGSVDLHNPKVVRASAGSLFRVPCCERVDIDSLLEMLGDAGVPVAATLADDGDAPESVALDGPIALLVGSEAHGLAPEVCDASRHRLSVPMEGRVESLNAAVAAAVVLFEAARQRRTRRSGGERPKLGHNVGSPRTGDDDTDRPETDR